MSYPPTLPYHDRKAGLTIFGCLTILFGVLFACFVPLMIIGATMAPGGQDMRTLLPGSIMYGGLAIAFVWLGIGSIMARRWARALLLIISWCWFVIGLVSTVAMAFAMPFILAAARTGGQPAPPPEAETFIIGFTVVFMMVLMVFIPGAYLLFYRSPHVKATCEAADPVERWTDRCPLPVITVSIWLLFTVPAMLVMVIGPKAVLPFFGSFLIGPAATALYLLLAGLWAYAAWAVYKLRPAGWWIAMISFALFGLSSFLTYYRHDILELYRLMEYPAAQIEQIEKMGFMRGTAMAWFSLAAFLPMLGYLLWVRKFFKPTASVTDP